MKKRNQQIADFIVAGLKEDIQGGDHTSLACINPKSRSKAKLLVKEDGIIAGVALAKKIFKHVDPKAKVKVLIKDGSPVKYGDIVFTVTSNSQALLKAERLLLNSMQRMSGIATQSQQYAAAVADLPVKVLDTRKTTPLIRFLEKWAVKIGGCTNYRTGLYDRFMIKDNHVDACGSIEEAIRRINTYNKKHKLRLKSTVEVRDIQELKKVLKVGKVNRIMLDNFTLPQMRKAVKLIDGKYEVEASGGVTMKTLRKIAKTGVNFISVGALTHSAKSMDMSLKIISTP